MENTEKTLKQIQNQHGCWQSYSLKITAEGPRQKNNERVAFGDAPE